MRRKPKPLSSIQTSQQDHVSQAGSSGEDLFRALLEDLHVGVALLGPDAEVQFANQAAADIFGISLQDAFGKTTDQLNLTGLREDGSVFPFPMRPVPQVIESQEAVRNHLIGFRHPGSEQVFWVYGNTTPQFSSDGSLRRVISTFTDVTAWKQAEDRLRESEERFRNAFESAAIGMSITALDGRWLRVNDSLCRIVGYSQQEMLALDFQSITHPADLEEDEKMVRKMIAGTIPSYHLEKRYVHKGGNAVWVLLSVSMVRDGQGEPLYFVSQVQDITEQKRAEMGLRQLSTRLLQLQEDERRRIARDLHDSFAQTLTGIALNLSQLSKSPKLRGKKEQRLLAETRRMTRALSRETRSLSYILHPPLLDEMGLVASIEEMAAGYSKRSGIRLELDLAANIGRLPPEYETAIFRVVQEALSNIQRHSGSASGKIRLKRDSGQITLEVSDDGRGIAAPATSGERAIPLGVGILGMKERMRQLGGWLEVVPASPGTLVLAALPIPAEVNHAGQNPHRR